MQTDIPPRRAAVLLCRELTRASDDKSRKTIRLLLSDIRKSLGHVVDLDEPASSVSRLGQRLLNALGDQRLNGRNIARLCGLQYSGRIRGELKALVEAKRLEKVSGHYVKKCPNLADTLETQTLINAENT